MTSIQIDRIEIEGSQSPHGLKIEIGGKIGQQVDDDIIIAMHTRGREFLETIRPTFEEAFERIFLQPRNPAKISDIDL